MVPGSVLLVPGPNSLANFRAMLIASLISFVLALIVSILLRVLWWFGLPGVGNGDGGRDPLGVFLPVALAVTRSLLGFHPLLRSATPER